MARYWCEYAWMGGLTATPAVLVSTDGASITEITSGVGCPPDALRLAGLTLPGLANTHSHAFQRALRGTTQIGAGSFWTWREQMYALAATLDPDSMRRLATAVFGEMVLAGVTCVGEFHYLHHAPGGKRYDDPVAMEAAVVGAARDAGLRITLLDVCYLHGGIGVEPNEVQRRFSDGDADQWAQRVSSVASRLEAPGVRVAAAAHSVRATSPRDIATVATWAHQNDAPVHAHVSEQPAENDQCRGAYGVSPTGLLAREGLLSSRFTAVHATHVDGADIELLASTGSTVSFCPTTERDLADGIGEAEALRRAGVPLVVGSDSHAVIDLLEEARLVELNQRLASGVRGVHTAAELAAMATVNGHRSLGWGDAGRLTVGARADLVSVRLDSPRTAGARADRTLEAVMFAGTAADVHHVVVDGNVLVTGGQHVRFDVSASLATAIADVTERAAS